LGCGQRVLATSRAASEIRVQVPGREATVLNISQNPDLYGVGALGAVVWPAAHVLLQFLASPQGMPYVKDASILEIGAGCGVVGLGVGALGARSVLLTDNATVRFPAVGYEPDGTPAPFEVQAGASQLDVLRQNIGRNEALLMGEIDVMKLTWGVDQDIASVVHHLKPQGLSLVVGSDVSYHSLSHHNLFATAKAILLGAGVGASAAGEPEGSGRRLLLSHHRRSTETTTHLLDTSQRLGFSYRDIDLGDDGGHSASEVACFEFILQEDGGDVAEPGGFL